MDSRGRAGAGTWRIRIFPKVPRSRVETVLTDTFRPGATPNLALSIYFETALLIGHAPLDARPPILSRRDRIPRAPAEQYIDVLTQ